MKRFLFPVLVLIILAGLAGLTGCEPRRTCLPEELVSAEVLNPESWGVIDTLTPTFSWAYPGDCLPARFNVGIAESLYREGLGMDDWPLLSSETLPGTATSWASPITLDPGREYIFYLQADSGGDRAPWLGLTFYTPPVCADDGLPVPVLTYPPDGQLMNAADGFRLRWEYARGCTPEGIRLQIDDDPAFGSPYDTHLAGGPLHWFSFSERVAGIEVCQTYYWRVATANGSTDGAPETVRAQSAFSETRRFHFFSLDCMEISGTPPVAFIPRMDGDCLPEPNPIAQAYAHYFAQIELAVDGRTQDLAWYHVLLPDGDGCWVPAETGDLNGSPQDLPVIPQQPGAGSGIVDPDPPSAPALNLDSTSCTPNLNRWTLSWSGATGADFYEVYVNGARVGQTADMAFQYSQIPPTPGTYTFQVMAYNKIGGTWSNSVAGTCP